MASRLLGAITFPGLRACALALQLVELILVTRHRALLQVVHCRQHGRHSKSSRQFRRRILGVLGAASLLSVVFPSTGTLSRLEDCCSVKAMVRTSSQVIVQARINWQRYEWYWNLYHKGTLVFEIEKLHERLGSTDPFSLHHAYLITQGPVVRIGPNDLHINDPDVFREMTKVGSPLIKDPEFYSFISFPGTSIGETDPNLHRIRRQVLTPAFSPQRVQYLAPMVKAKVDRLLERFNGFASQSEPVNMFKAAKAFTMDIISDIVLGKELGCMDDPEFKNQFIEYLHASFSAGWIGTAFPNFLKFSLTFPIFPLPIMEFRNVHISYPKTPRLQLTS